MNCDEYVDLLGLGDDELVSEERDRLAEHLGACASCRASRQELTQSRQALGRLAVPALSAAEVERMASAALPGRAASLAVPLPGGRRRAARWISWASHAAAIFLGVLLARSWGGGLFTQESASDPVDLAAVEPRDPAVREVLVEVPVETIVERIVEVPVEVPVEVAVEVPVEVEVRVEVEKIVYRDRAVVHPLQVRWDAQLAVASKMGAVGLLTLQGIDRALIRIADGTGGSDQIHLDERAIIADAEPPVRGRARAVATASSRAHVEVRRQSGRVTLVTRGSLADVVPVLIDTLETGDEAVAAAAFDQLQSIRADFGEEGLALQAPSEKRSRPGGIRGLLYKPGEQAPALAPRDPALWRDWWNRQRAASGVTVITTSI